MRQLIIAAVALLATASAGIAQDPVITPADGTFPLPGIYSLVPHSEPDPNMADEITQALLQANCFSPTVFAANGVGMSFITVARGSKRVASMQRLQQCSVDGEIMSCKQARKRSGAWSIDSDQSASTWRLKKSEDDRTLICGPGDGAPPVAGSACYSLNLCPAEIGDIDVARSKGSTINTMQDDPPL